MSQTPHRLAVLIGSTRPGRFGPVAGRWFAHQASLHGQMDVDLIDLAETPLPEGTSAEAPAEAAELGRRLDQADAFVIVTPEYNHSFPAPLKHAIDLFKTQWYAKPVAFVSYGGMGGGLRAVEQLRLVFAELHAMSVRDTVSFHRFWEVFDEAGQPTDEGCARAAKGMLDQLVWWSDALRTARAANPYGR